MNIREAFTAQLATIQTIQQSGLDAVKAKYTDRTFDNVSVGDKFGLLFYMEEAADGSLSIQSAWTDQLQNLEQTYDVVSMVGYGTTPRLKLKTSNDQLLSI